MERVLDVKVDGTKLLVVEDEKFFSCKYRDPQPEEQIQLGPDDLTPALLRICHGRAIENELGQVAACRNRPKALDWTRLSRTVERF